MLQITDPKLLGAIATCPACGSMVEVPASTDRTPPDAVARNESTATSDSPTAKPPGPHPPTNPPKVPFAIGDASVDSAAVTEESILAEGVLTGAPPPSGFTADPIASQPVDQVPTTSDAAPGPGWQSDQSQNVRKIGLMIAAALIGLATIGVAITAWVRSDRATARNQPTTTSPVPNKLDTNQPQTTPDPADASATPPRLEDNGPNDSEANQKAPTTDETAIPDITTTETKTPSADTKSAQSMATNPTLDTGLPSLVPDPILGSPSGKGTSENSTRDAMIDPPTIGAADKEIKDDGASQLKALPKGLLPFMPFVPIEAPKTKPTLETPPSMDEVRLEAAAEADDPLQPPKDRTIKPNTDLAMSIAIKAKDYPAVDLLLVLSSLTDVPIELDLTAFDIAGISVRKEFSPQSTKPLSILEWVREIASFLDGRLRFEPTYVVIEPTDEAFQSGWKTLTEREDLPDSTTALQSFLRIKAEDDRLVNEEAGRDERMLAALACESLRRMRGIAPKMDQDRMLRWAGALDGLDDSPSVSGWPMLEKMALTDQPDTPISIVRFLQSIGKQTQSAVLVNWLDLTRRGNGPATRVFPDIERDPATAIPRTLEPFRIQVRRIDANHLWVGSEFVYDRLPVLVWTDPLGERKIAFENQLKAATVNLPENGFRHLHDPVSDRALVMIPRFIHRQMNKIMDVLAVR